MQKFMFKAEIISPTLHVSTIVHRFFIEYVNH